MNDTPLKIIIPASLLNSLLSVLPFTHRLFFDLHVCVIVYLAVMFIACFTESRLQRTQILPGITNHSTGIPEVLCGIVLLSISWVAVGEYLGTSREIVFGHLLGFLLLAAGISLRAMAVARLGARFVSHLYVPPDQVLITDGVYRYMRHPSETGILCLGFGTSVYFQSILAFLAAALVLSPLVLYRVKKEERFLEARFGDAYRLYSSHTPALMPSLKKVQIFKGCL